ncbi:hypothetical protein SVIOM74S_00291 [Streptomyces violarus]
MRERPLVQPQLLPYGGQFRGCGVLVGGGAGPQHRAGRVRAGQPRQQGHRTEQRGSGEHTAGRRRPEDRRAAGACTTLHAFSGVRVDVDERALARVEDHALDTGGDALHRLLVDQWNDGVGAQDLRLRTHDLLLAALRVALRGGGPDGLVHRAVLQPGDVVDALAGEVAGEVVDRVTGVEERDPGEDEGVVLPGEEVGLHLRVLTHVLLHGEPGLLQLLLEHGRGLGQLGPVGVGGQPQRPALGPGLHLGGRVGLGAAGHVHPLVGGPRHGGPEQALRGVGVPAEDGVDQGGTVDCLPGGGAQTGVGEQAAAGVEDQAVGAHGGHLVPRVLVEQLRLSGGDPLGDVGLAAAQRVGAGRAVRDPAHVDAGRLRLAAPVAVEAVELRFGLAAEPGDLERAGAGTGRADGAVLAVRLRRQDRQRGAGQPQRQHGVGVLVVRVTVSASSALAVRATSLSTRGLGLAALAWSSALTTDWAVNSVPSWNSALRSSKVQVVSSSCFHDFASPGLAVPFRSRAVRPSATDSLLSTVASLLYGESACTGGGTASATRSRPPDPAPAPVPSPLSLGAKQPASRGGRTSAAMRRGRWCACESCRAEVGHAAAARRGA